MWTYIAPWMVEDGEISELQPGQPLPNVGLRASCWSIRESPWSEAVTELYGADPDGFLTVHYDVTGAVEWTRGPCSLVLRVKGLRLLAEPNGVREVPTSGPAFWNPQKQRWQRPHGLEPYLPDFWLPTIGSQVTVQCHLWVMADYEFDAFGFPDLRGNWIVERIKVERRAKDRRGDGGHRHDRLTNVVNVDEIDQIRPGTDEIEGLSTAYLLDLIQAG